MNGNIRRIEQKEKQVREDRIAQMKKGQRTKEEILSDLLALQNDFTDAGQKKEQELFAEKRRLKITQTL